MVTEAHSPCSLTRPWHPSSFPLVFPPPHEGPSPPTSCLSAIADTNTNTRVLDARAGPPARLFRRPVRPWTPLSSPRQAAALAALLRWLLFRSTGNPGGSRLSLSFHSTALGRLHAPPLPPPCLCPAQRVGRRGAPLGGGDTTQHSDGVGGGVRCLPCPALFLHAGSETGTHSKYAFGTAARSYRHRAYEQGREAGGRAPRRVAACWSMHGGRDGGRP